MYKNPFPILQSSLWPLLLGLSAFSTALTFIFWLHNFFPLSWLLFNASLFILLPFLWWNDMLRESLAGNHTANLQLSLRVSFILFILSEVFFFVSFFWAYFDSSLSPTPDIGIQWPPMGITPLDIYSLPLLNTILLLSSGVTITWAHHSIQNNLHSQTITSIVITITLGATFLFCQYYEYSTAPFTIADGVYGSTFYIATGFHGFHVTVGTIFLSYVLYLALRRYLTHHHHFSFEAATWYWHFVDVVWLFLYITIYYWGSL